MIKKRSTIKKGMINLILMFLILGFLPQIYAGEVSSAGITTITEGLDEGSIFDSIEKIYEISPSRLKKGYSTILNEKEAFRIQVDGRDYYIILWDVLDEGSVNLIFPKERQLTLEIGDIVLVDVNKNNKFDVRLELKPIEDINLNQSKKANLFIKEFVESELIPTGDYFELFDVTVILVEKEIYNARELGALITFENFGEGASEIEIVYSIIDSDNLEVYQGVDSLVVQTEDSVVKNFNFLELPFGKYILRTEIFYGQNQTGESEQDFEIVEVPVFLILKEPLFFILIIIILSMIIGYVRRVSKGDMKKLKEI